MKIKKEDLTILVVLILIIIALVYVIPKFTGDAVDSIPCVDSDGGKIYTVQGTVQKGVAVQVTDYCLDDVQLREHYCSENQFKALEIEYYDCPNGCSNGACVEKATPTTTGTLGAEKPFVSASNIWFWVVIVVALIVLFLILKKFKK
jgi:hypothetical protein